MKKLLLLLSLVASPAFAQGDIPAFSVPVGGGPAVQGWFNVGPCAAGQTIVWPSTSVVPICGEPSQTQSFAGVLPITSNLAGSVWQIGLQTPLATQYGGTGLISPAAGGTLVTNGAAALGRVGMSSGQILIGSASQPAAQTISGAITIDSAGVTTFNGNYLWRYSTDNVFVGSNNGNVIGTGGNTGVGSNAGLACTTCQQNTFVGALAGDSMIGGAGNIFIGYAAGNDITSTSDSNTVVGHNAVSNSVGGLNNTVAIGASSGSTLTNGDNNTFIGFNTGGGITTGGSNTILGANVTGLTGATSFNVILADGAGTIKAQWSQTGILTLPAYSTAGCLQTSAAGVVSSTGVACGGGGGGGGVVTTAIGNTFAGSAGNLTLTGRFNSALGGNTAINLTGPYLVQFDASFNTAMGYGALESATTASSQTAFGYNALNLSNAGQSTAVGYLAGANERTGGANVYVGNTACGNNWDGNSNICIGTAVGASFIGRGASATLSGSTNPSDGQTVTLDISRTIGSVPTPGTQVYIFKNTLTGAANEVKIAATATLSWKNLACAINRQWQFNGCVPDTDYDADTVINPRMSALGGTNSIRVWANSQDVNFPADNLTVATNVTGATWSASTLAVPSATTGSNNVFIGDQAGFGSTTPFYNVLIGLFAGQWIDTADETTCIGATACLSVTTGVNNVAYGANALGGDYDPVGRRGCAITGSQNTAIGYQAMLWTCTAAQNTVVGQAALVGIAPTQPSQTFTAVGQPADASTIVVGSTTYTFRTTLSTGPTIPNEILIGGSVDNAFTNLACGMMSNTQTGCVEGVNYSTGTPWNPVLNNAGSASYNTTSNILTVTGTDRYADGTGVQRAAIPTTGTPGGGSWGAATMTGGAVVRALTGVGNAVFGNSAMFSAQTTSSSNTALGGHALGGLVVANSNIGIGRFSGGTLVDGEWNTIIGTCASLGGCNGIVSGDSNTIIGSRIAGLADASNQVILGDGAGNIRYWHNGTTGILTNYAATSIFQRDSDANAGPTVRLHHNTASPAPSDVIGTVNFTSTNTDGTPRTYAAIVSTAQNVTPTTEIGDLNFQTQLNGTLATRVSLISSAFYPTGAGTVALGSGSAGWSALHMANNTAINWANGQATITSTAAGNFVFGTNSTTSGHPIILVNSATGNSSVTGPTIQLHHDKGTAANNDIVGRMIFSGEDSTGAVTNYGLVQIVSTDVADLSEDSEWRFHTYVAGATNQRFAVGDGVYITSKVRALGTAPALTSCGGGSPAIEGSDMSGTVTMGTTATGCVITFNAAYTNAPRCLVTWRATPLASQSYAVSNTAITLTQTSTSGNVVDYICTVRSGG